MELGNVMGMKTVFINPGLNGNFDKCFTTMKDFSKSIS
jgi:hypothetical protein